MNPMSDYVRRVESAFQVLRGKPTAAEREAREMRGAYAGALFSRLNADWIVSALPSDQELVGDLKTLRTRSRDLGRNNPFCVRFLELAQENVVGAGDIDFRLTLTDGSGGILKTEARQLHDKWRRFCDEVSVDGRHAMADFSQLGISNAAQDGEIFVRKHVGRQFRFGLGLEFVDADLLDEGRNIPRDDWRGTNEIRLSVEVDRQSRRVGYHCYEEPFVLGARSGKTIFVPAKSMLHVGRARRVNQTRFVPWFHPVMDSIKMLDGLTEAELVASRAAAAKMGWLVNKNDGKMLGEKQKDGTRAPIPMDASPGSVAVAPVGWEFQGWDPQHPTTAFATFHAAMIRRIAAGLNVSYTSLANDPGDANYSSSRSALQMEQRFWRKIQQFFVRQFMQPIYEEWLVCADLVGEIQLDRIGFEQARLVKWEVPGWEWIDPKSDVEAAILAIDNNLDSRQRIVGARGLDFEEDVLAPNKDANAMLSEAGLLPRTASTGGAPPQGDTPPDGTNRGSADAGRSAPPNPTDAAAA